MRILLGEDIVPASRGGVAASDSEQTGWSGETKRFGMPGHPGLWPPLLTRRGLLPSAFLLTCFLASLSGCARDDLDTDILAEVNSIRAIDNHAHPVRFVGSDAPDKFFDALPVENMEPASDPAALRPGTANGLAAWRALWNYPYNDSTPEHMKEWLPHKHAIAQQQANGYPAWVLDKAGIDIMLANRVEMGPSIQPPRFKWVPYIDALIFPLDNSQPAAKNPDRKAFFGYEDTLRERYLKEANQSSMPKTLDEYLRLIVTPTLERHKQGGAVAEKFEVAYLRQFGFDKVDRAAAGKIYATYVGKAAPSDADYKPLQDFLFRYIAAECGRLGMPVHLHTSAGAGSYFDVAGANALRLEPLFDDPDLRKTKFVMVHGGWPFIRETTALLTKPNAYLDYSAQSFLIPPATLAQSIREWLEYVPEKVLFGTDGYPYFPELDWEETTWIASARGREALAIALAGMVKDREIPRARAAELANMVMRENARRLYGF